METAAVPDPAPLPADPPRRRVRRAVAVLALACVFWGSSFPLMQFAMDAFTRIALAHRGDRPPTDPDLAMRATINGWRFLAASLLYLAISARRQRGMTARDAAAGATVGCFFAGGLFLQLAGLRYALPSISAMLTALVVVFTPFAQALIWRRRIPPAVWLATIIALTGIVVLAAPNAGASAVNTIAVASPLPFTGELLTILSALFFTGQILSVDRLGAAADPWRMTLAMFAATAVGSLALAWALGGGWLYQAALIRDLLADPVWVGSMLSMVVLSSVVAFHLMNTWQPHIPPAVAAVVYCLEPVFATLISIVARTESATIVTLVGGLLVIAAVLLAARASSRAT